jgi:hypothetical protein
MAERVVPAFPWAEPMLPHVDALGVGQGMVKREASGVASGNTPYNAPFYLSWLRARAAARCRVHGRAQAVAVRHRLLDQSTPALSTERTDDESSPGLK